MEGNRMKMREAVEAALSELDKFGQVHDARIHFADIVHIGRARGMLQAALSAPPRQCEVGTAEEQVERWRTYCSSHRSGPSCDGCPLETDDSADCYAVWMQKPYEAQ